MSLVRRLCFAVVGVLLSGVMVSEGPLVSPNEAVAAPNADPTLPPMATWPTDIAPRDTPPEPPVLSSPSMGASVSEAGELDPSQPAVRLGNAKTDGETVVVDVSGDLPVAVAGLDLVVSVGDGALLKKNGKPVPPKSKRRGKVKLTTVGKGKGKGVGLTEGGFQIEQAEAAVDPIVVKVVVDYQSLLLDHPQDWAARLRMQEVPACGLLPDAPTDCTVSNVATVNDLAAGTLTAEIVVQPNLALPAAATPAAAPAPAAAPEAAAPTEVSLTPATSGGEFVPGAAQVEAPVVAEAVPAVEGAAPVAAAAAGTSTFGIIPGYDSTFGSYTATPFSTPASWSTGLSTGSFEWQYKVPMVPVGFGGSPSVSLSYSSAAVDNVSASLNGQPELGWGWILSAGGYIERSYRTCSQDGVPAFSTKYDLCWFTSGGQHEFFSLVLNGKSSELIAVGANEWRLKDDPTWKVVRKNRALAPGQNQQDTETEWFEVWTPDGMHYGFGEFASATGSVWTVPVYGDHPTEPCNNVAPADAWCQQGWRFNLDNVEDPNGNQMDYLYAPEENYYARFRGNATSGTLTRYIRGGSLTQIRYGRRAAEINNPDGFMAR